MIDLKLAQKQPEVVEKALKERHSKLDMREFRALDERRRALLAEVEGLKSQRNTASDEVAAIKRAGGDASDRFAELGELSERIKKLDAEVAGVKAGEEAWLLSVPNLPDSSVPQGADEKENVEVARWGTPRSFDFTPEEHGELGTRLGGLDFARAAKLTGSRFVVERAWAARLDRALANFFLDQHTKHEGYIEISPPYMVNRVTMTGTGQLPKFEEDLFKVRDWDYYLIPTAEVPLTNLHAGETLDEAELPLAYCAATPCFRSEAGSAGKDTRGMIRMHQFTKVEMVRFAHPDDSMAQLELMTGHARHLLELLELPYRVITLCTGDLGFSAAKTYDVEVWLPSQNTYREISSCSNCTDFQARRANIRFKPKGGKAAWVHTLNGSGLPTGRTMAAILENGQQKDGSVVLPKVLVPYMDGVEVIEPVR
ncbi:MULTISPECIES: serine--tRNA ligase [unclassified Desulfovibrio]|uniref:serine--tRNA ligase n=1 Tax=unclassified Desulfovibrio TaxID=2593640 RepID=UPI0013ED86AA|nr:MULTISPECIES: serine--tRNA ligase [unclassified Desulfovibrio]